MLEINYVKEECHGDTRDIRILSISTIKLIEENVSWQQRNHKI